MTDKHCAKILLILILFLICGCATTGRKISDLETQELKNQILVLDRQIEEKDNLINDLKLALQNAKEESYSRQINTPAVKDKKSKRTTKQIQTALKNAGYNPGKTDGKMGKQTKSAVKMFQKDNSLKVNGKVNERTWKLLSKYVK